MTTSALNTAAEVPAHAAAPMDIPKPLPEAEAVYRRWLSHLSSELTRHTSYVRRSEIVRDELHMIILGRPHGGRTNAALVSELPLAVLAESFDPRNVTLAAEMEPDTDRDRFLPIKPLICFWRGFDRSILGANLWLGLRFRAMLGQHIFAGMGRNVRFYRDVAFERGYTLTFADDTTVRPGVRIDDREARTISGVLS